MLPSVCPCADFSAGAIQRRERARVRRARDQRHIRCASWQRVRRRGSRL